MNAHEMPFDFHTHTAAHKCLHTCINKYINKTKNLKRRLYKTELCVLDSMFWKVTLKVMFQLGMMA